MKKIKIISYENFPFGGAPANLLRYFSLALASTGADVEVILPTGNVYGKNIEAKSKKKGNIEDVRYKHLCFTQHPHNYLGKALDILCGLFLTPLYLIIDNWRNKFDIVILYDVQILRSFNLVLFKKVFRKKLILIMPEFYEKPNLRSTALMHWYDFYLGVKFFLKYADAYITASHYLKEYLLREHKIKKPILILPNLMDPDIFRVDNSALYKKGSITIGYTGTPTRKDGVTDLIESFYILNKKYPRTHLLIIGDVINGISLIPKLKERVLQLGIDGSVSFTGLVPFNEIPGLLNSCQILALTRPNGVFAEAGFPTKLGEYFACKKPVLITRVGDIPLYFNNNVHLIMVEPENINEIVNGFEKIINDMKLSEKLSVNAYNWMNENLNYRNQCRKLSTFINVV